MRSASSRLREGAASLSRRSLRSPWNPPPVQRLIEPYLPPPARKLRRAIPAPSPATMAVPSTAPAPSSNPKRKAYVRRGVLRVVDIQPRYLPSTSQGIRTRLKYSLSVDDTETAQQTAVQVLDNQLLAPSSSDPEAQRNNRTALYTMIVRQFLNRPTTANFEAVYKLFQRQHAEGLSVDPQILTVYLSAALGNPLSTQSPMNTIAAIFPFLPETYDLHLLTLILSTTVKHARPPPEEVKAMIKDCMPTGPKGEKFDAMQSWDLELWDVYMGSLLADGQLKEAVRMLGIYQTAVWRQQEENTKSPGAPKFNPTPAAVTRTYISLLSHWVEAGFPDQLQPRRYANATRRKNGSNTPRAIAVHCFETLRGASPPVELLNAWLAAEVAGGNQERAERLWDVISGMKWDKRALKADVEKGLEERRDILEMLSNPNWQTGTPMSVQIPPDLAADGSTYTAHFKLLKRMSYPPSRLLLRHFLSTPSNVDAKSLNAALSTLFTVTVPTPDLPSPKANDPIPDLPAALVLLEQFQPLRSSHSNGIPPLPRTLDIVAAGLLKLARQGLQIFDDFEPQLHGSRLEKKQSGLVVESAVENRISLREWDRISQELHYLRDGDTRSGSSPVMLPVGQPFARLVDDLSPSPVGQITVGSTSESDTIQYFSASQRERSGVARELLPALAKLLKRGIGAQMVHRDGEASEERVEEVIEGARRALGVAKV